MEGFGKKIEKGLRGAAAGAMLAGGVIAGDGTSTKAEAGFVPLRQEKVCVLKNATDFEYQLDGKMVKIPIPQTGDPTSGQLESGGSWQLFDDNGVTKYRLKSPGPGEIEITLECEAIS